MHVSSQSEHVIELEQEIAQLSGERQELFARLVAVESERANHILSLAMAAHALSSPLQSLTLATDLMFDRMSGAVDDSSRGWLLDHLAQQQQSLARLRCLVQSWLVAPELQAGVLVSKTTRCDLGDLVRNVTQRLEDDLVWAGCELELRLQRVVADWDGLTVDTVVSNVIGNAIKYGARNPIVVGLTRRRDEAIVTVRDHGIGIARADRERIFERLARVDSSARTPGMGVGLWICRSLLRNIGGTIDVEAGHGRGVVFTIKLPIAGG